MRARSQIRAVYLVGVRDQPGAVGAEGQREWGPSGWSVVRCAIVRPVAVSASRTC